MERNKRKRSQRRSAPGQLALFADAHEPEPVANAEAAPEPAVDAETIGRQYGLRERAVTLLAALLRMPDTDGWVGPVSRDELAKAAGQSLATTKRALKDLYLAEVLVCRKRPRGTGGTARSYWVPVVAISREPAHALTGEPAHPVHPPAPPQTHYPPKKERSIDPSAQGQGGTIPTLPSGCWSDEETELPDRLRRYVERRKLCEDDLPGERGMLGLLAAVLATRDALQAGRLRSGTGYVMACLRGTIGDGYLARADRLLRRRTRSPPAYSPHGLPDDDPQVQAVRRRGE